MPSESSFTRLGGYWAVSGLLPESPHGEHCAANALEDYYFQNPIKAPLTNALEGYFESRSSEVPTYLLAVFNHNLPQHPVFQWDNLPPNLQRERAQYLDYRNHPANEQRRELDEAQFSAIWEIEEKIKTLERMKPNDPLAFESKERQLAGYREKLQQLEQEYSGRFSVPEPKEAAQSNRPVEVEERADSGRPTKSKRTANATKTRQNHKQARLDALKRFIVEMERRAEKARLELSRKDLYLTKADFHAVFVREHPQFKDVRPATLADDLPHFGVAFHPGSKHKNNNVLEHLFPVQE